jgi:hypothetical protein
MACGHAAFFILKNTTAKVHNALYNVEPIVESVSGNMTILLTRND